MALLVLTNGLQYILCGLHQYIHQLQCSGGVLPKQHRGLWHWVGCCVHASACDCKGYRQSLHL